MKTSMQRSAGRRVAYVLALSCAIAVAAVSTLAAQDNPTPPYKMLPPDQLDSMVAPIALYADPLLAQVMLASTYPEQIHQASQWVRANGTGGVDNQPWDVSIKAVAHYPTVLNMLDMNLDWTRDLGAAYANQSTDLMASVQRMRAIARDNGNLVTTPQQQVMTDPGTNDISVVPAQPRVIYVPVYNPWDVYYNSCIDFYCATPYVGFSVGYPIGPWLMYDWDWPGRRIFYTGWVGGGWIGRSRPFVGFNGVYMNERLRTVGFNRGALPGAGLNRGGFNRNVATTAGLRAGMEGRATAGRQTVPAQRQLISRAQAPTQVARSQSAQVNRAGTTNAAARQGAPSYARQSAPASRSQQVQRQAYQPQRQAAPVARQSYAVQRQASAAPRGGSSGGSRSSGGGGRSAARGRR